MADCKITGLRSIELGVTDLERSARFYSEVWGLEQVSSEPDARYFRANGTEHHAVCIRQAGQAGLIGVSFAAQDKAAVDALHAQARAAGVASLGQPQPLSAAAGGGYGVTLQGPEGLRVTVSCDVAQSPERDRDPSKPHKLTHVVFNSADVPEQMNFFL
ncbi:MAG: glyoxalase-like domain protein, partial [Noviherbaspirillum sp.]|nr:glyoxalase-like domain protein [Noviherbaspirillum sp.]